MASPTQLFRLVNEFVFILVGGLLVLFALTGRYLFNPRQPAWLVLSAVMILWGLRAWRRSRLTRPQRGPIGRKDRGRLACAGWTDSAFSGLGAFSMGWMAAAGCGRHLRVERIGFRGDPGSCRLIGSMAFCEMSAGAARIQQRKRKSCE